MADRTLADIPTPVIGALIDVLIAEIDARDGDVDLEDCHDVEGETWSHTDDHPAELFIGSRQ